MFLNVKKLFNKNSLMERNLTDRLTAKMFFNTDKYNFSKFLKNTNSENKTDSDLNFEDNSINPMYDYTKHTLIKYLYIFGYNSDNIGYILHEPTNKILIGIDFGEYEKSKIIVEKLEKQLQSRLKYILTTHSHWDHSNGNKPWKDDRGDELTIVGGSTKGDVIPHANKLMKDLETMTIGELCIACMHTPGHIRSHVCYVVTHVAEKSTKIPFLFCGDTLFIGGCGRIFDGTHEELYNSLKTLSYLPNDTFVFPGHEYSQKNLEFCLKLDPENEFLKDKYEWVKDMRKKGEFTVGGRLIEEKLYNPFLRSGEDYYLNLTGENTAEQSFKKLRMLKDKF